MEVVNKFSIVLKTRDYAIINKQEYIKRDGLLTKLGNGLRRTFFNSKKGRELLSTYLGTENKYHLDYLISDIWGEEAVIPTLETEDELSNENRDAETIFITEERVSIQ